MQANHNTQEKSVSGLLKEFKKKYNVQDSNKANFNEPQNRAPSS